MRELNPVEFGLPDDQSLKIGFFKNSLRRHQDLQPSRTETFTRDQDTDSDQDELYLEKEQPKPPHTIDPAPTRPRKQAPSSAKAVKSQPLKLEDPARAATERRSLVDKTNESPPRTRPRYREPAID
ncbi:hypothetical protein DY000_02004787 [Brassica cretica]|uniref:Shugoshin C-terminal domain-containing protein n=1 Tax=Brassica cretica TaxID=69181 RepID=A0ABQ7C8S1_BRACR|nr:hypothetical protein DY000_02004787 [Brassica cretica]